jgi:hypothetical protein
VTFITARKQEKVSTKVVINSNDPQQPEARWQISGFVKRTVNRYPAGGLFVLSLDAGPGQTGSIRLENQMEQPMTLKLLEQSIEGIKFDIKEQEPGRVYEVNATTTKDFDIGQVRGTVTFFTGLEREPKMELPVYVRIYAGVETSPRALYVHPVTQRAPTTRTIMVENYGNMPFVVREAHCAHPGVKVTLGTLRVLPRRPGSNAPSPVAHVPAQITLPPGPDIPPEGIIVEFTTNQESYPKAQLLITTDTQKYNQIMYGGDPES